ncbi:hypothetical protein V8E54_011143, partial [Elaphomyces granulatus]
NPLWPEIQSQLLPGQSVFDIPGVINSSFHGRLEKLKAGRSHRLDSFISAELPDPNELYNQVRRLHVHSQGHLTRPGSRCNRNGRCQYNYLQPITPTTYVDDLGSDTLPSTDACPPSES